MKSKPEFDPDLPARSQRRLWPIRSIRQLMAVVVISGLLLAVSVTLARQPLSSVVYWDPSLTPASPERARLAFFPAPDTASAEPLVIACPIDPQPSFVIRDQMRRPIAKSAPRSIDSKMVKVAPESIDPKMVVRAPAWIDPKMVFAPGGGDGQPETGNLPAPAPRVPGIAPGWKKVSGTDP
jgi:hypothetical protein